MKLLCTHCERISSTFQYMHNVLKKIENQSTNPLIPWKCPFSEMAKHRSFFYYGLHVLFDKRKVRIEFVT